MKNKTQETYIVATIIKSPDKKIIVIFVGKRLQKGNLINYWK